MVSIEQIWLVLASVTSSALCVGFGLKFGNECLLVGNNLGGALGMGEFAVGPAFLGGLLGVILLLVRWIRADAGVGFLVDSFQLFTTTNQTDTRNISKPIQFHPDQIRCTCRRVLYSKLRMFATFSIANIEQFALRLFCSPYSAPRLLTCTNYLVILKWT